MSEAVPKLDIEKAMQEIKSIPPASIHREAAYAWGARSVAAYRFCTATTTLEECLRYYYLGEHYREAALAHAAMGDQWKPLYNEIERAMAKDRTKAFAAVQKNSGEPRRPATRRRAAS